VATSDKLIQVVNLKKYYNGEAIKALDGVNLDIYRGDVVVVIGPSGSGKSTLLRSLNLLEVPTSGQIIFEGTDITQKKGPDGKKLNIDLHRQKMGMVFQHFNLFPHKTILQNMTLAPVKVKGIAPEAAEKKARELLERVGLADRADAYPIQLSGGQKQRVAVARAIVNEPAILLLDEPLGALDLKLRRQMQRELKALQQKLHITFVYITHDQEEARYLSDRIIVMNEGRIEQIAPTEELFAHPATDFVREFIEESRLVQP